VLDSVVSRLPRPIREPLYKHKELVKFTVVGGTTFVIDTVIFLVLKHSVLETKPIVSKVISTMVATIVSYILNREWSFRTRGGRVRHHEAALFFVISGIGIGVTSAPLAVSRYLFDLTTPHVTVLTQEVADFVSAQIVGTVLAMVFRWWAFRRFVFPHADARPRIREEEIDLTAAELLGDVWPLIDEPDGVLDSDDRRLADPTQAPARDTEDPVARR
jgi:putative flippase GtrA